MHFLQPQFRCVCGLSDGVCLCAREPLPGPLGSRLTPFQRLLLLRCLRADRLTHGLQDFVSAQLGQRFIEPQVAHTLYAVYAFDS